MKRPGPAQAWWRCAFATGLALAAATTVAHSEPTARSASVQPADVCVDVQIGGDHSRYYDCLNGEMRRQAAAQANQRAVVQSAVNNSQPTSPTQMGLYNQAATRERLGNAFGHSVVPQRPQQNFVNPLIH